MWGLVGLMLAGLATGIIAAFVLGNLARPQQGPGVMGTVVMTCATGIGSLVFGIWSLILIMRYRRAFADARSQAMQSWAQSAAAGE